MDTMRVIIENWPSSSWLDISVPIAIALFALLVSIYSAWFTRREFVLSHRPYAIVQTFAYLDSRRQLVTDLKKVMYRCLNAPAQTVRTEYRYSVVRRDRIEEEVVDTRRDDVTQVLYPFDPGTNQVTYTTDFDLTTLAESPDIQKLFRTVSLTYKEISSRRHYRFEGRWEYDRDGRTWKPLRLTAD